MNFTYNAPTKVYFGQIDYNSLVEEIKQYGNKVLILTGGKRTQEVAEKICDNIKPYFTIVLKTGIKTNPEIEMVEKIAREVRDADVILTIGGGSVHDSGKALAIAMTHEGDLKEYTTDGQINVQGITKKVIPIITVPTIFGTGAEVSPASLLRIDNRKRVIFSTYLYPKVSFVDCSLTTNISKDMCIKVALDALVQGVESLVSTKAQSFSKRFSYSAIDRTVSNLLKLVEENVTHEIIEELALASLEGMYAVGQSTVGAAHAISDPISGRFNIHHGEAVGILLPYVVEANYSYAMKEYNIVKDIFERELNETFNSLKDALNAFYIKIGFNRFDILGNIDLTLFINDLEEIISECYNGDLVGNPRDMTDDIIGNILKNAIGVN